MAMARQVRIAKDAVVALLRFARAYRGMCVIAAAVYAASAVLTVRYLPLLLPPGWARSEVSSWAGSLPQTVLLAPVWTALLRFVILREEGRRYLAWDYRVRRMLLVTVILSAILMAGGMLFALSLDVLPRFRIRRVVALAVLAVAFGARMVSWWLVMRLAIAPALAAAGTRRYAIDTAFAFTRRWIGTIFGVKLIIYSPLFVLVGGLRLAAGFRPDLQADMLALPLSVAVVTLASALVELTDAAAMALVAVRIVRARKGEDEDDSMS
jgi:hypothetical protein